MHEVKLVSITPRAEETMAYCARVSNPANQENTNIARLLGYCASHGHWSVFEQANMILEINTSRALAPQILRHRSFSFQEFSQRYAVADGYVPAAARRQDGKNRQNSFDDLGEDTKDWFLAAQEEIWELSFARYKESLGRGIAKECARSLLPLSTRTRLYMNGTVRSWIHYLSLRTKPDTQLEHRLLAEDCRKIFLAELPVVAKALGWSEGSGAS